jgi:AcrR family transcriptional regulator
MRRRAPLGARPTRGNPNETRERLIEAAAKLLNTVGFDRTDSNKIARAAGYSPGTFYKHFEDKRAVMIAVYKDWIAAEWQAIDDGIAGGSTMEEVLELVVAQHIRWRVFRANWNRLGFIDARVKREQIRSRAHQVKALQKLGLTDASRCFVALCAVERVADLIADGQAKALGLERAALVSSLRIILMPTHVGKSGSLMSSSTSGNAEYRSKSTA